VQNGRSEEQQYSFKAKFCYSLSVVMWTEKWKGGLINCSHYSCQLRINS